MVKAMNEEAQRIAIAEFIGVIACPHWTHFFYDQMAKGDCGHEKCVPECYWPPRYTEDLNAMHEAEKTLNPPPSDCEQDREYDDPLWVCYEHELCCICPMATVIRATAAQRAEAFLRTIGRWEDGK